MRSCSRSRRSTRPRRSQTHKEPTATAPTTGHHHALVRDARALHLKKHRQERRCFLIEGPACVEAALAQGHVKVDTVFVAEDGARSHALAASASSAGIAVLHVDRRTLDSIAQTREPQGIVAVARFFHHGIDELPKIVGTDDAPCVVAVLHHIGDPGNAGTLVRSADALGAAAVVCGADGVDPYNDKVVRASMGAIFRLPLFLYDGWHRFVEVAKRAGLAIAAADVGAPDVRSVTVPRRTALLVGHERRGLADIPGATIALHVGIPQRARTESLNAAVAGSIALYEIARAAGCLPAAVARTNDAQMSSPSPPCV